MSCNRLVFRLQFLRDPGLIRLHTVKWFQILLTLIVLFAHS